MIEPSALEQLNVGEEAGDLVIPPAEEIEALYQLVRIGNMQSIGERAGHLQAIEPVYAPFAQRLRLLAQRFQSTALVAFVARYRTGHEAALRAQTPV